MRERRALVAIDLGAESCRVSLLRWDGDEPTIRVLHRVPNGPIEIDGRLHWPLDKILAGIDRGLRMAAEAAPEGIRSIAVDGWAVDYVRLTCDDEPADLPHCYRDERTVKAKKYADALVQPLEMFTKTGAQPLRINTVYQLVAEMKNAAGNGDDAGSVEGIIRGNIQDKKWILLPEFVLFSLGGRRVAEYTNATHTGLVDLRTGDWSRQIFEGLGLAIDAAPPIVRTGSVVGKLSGPLAELAAFADTDLIAPACHDTASAIAAITTEMQDAAYIVSGTWSLVGTLLERPISNSQAYEAGFTNQGAAGGGFCFHTNVNGMWLLKQCLDHWRSEGRGIELDSLVATAGERQAPDNLIEVDAAPLLLGGNMPALINDQLIARGSEPISNIAGNEAIFARLIFESLAARYAVVLENLTRLTGREFKRISLLGGGSRNSLLRRLTEERCGLPVVQGEAEGSTIGNFAVQLAAGESGGEPPSRGAIRRWAERLGT